MRPTTGTNTGASPRGASSLSATARRAALGRSPFESSRTSTARGRFGSRRRKPLRSSIVSWCATLDVDARPADSQISRMLGG